MKCEYVKDIYPMNKTLDKIDARIVKRNLPKHKLIYLFLFRSVFLADAKEVDNKKINVYLCLDENRQFFFSYKQGWREEFRKW